MGRKIWVRWDSRLVRLFNDRFEQIAVHPKGDPGSFNTLQAHLSDRKISTVERGATWLLTRASYIGEATEQWAISMMQQRGVAGLRILQGLLALAKRHSSADIEKACEIAHSYGAYRLANVRRLIQRKAAKQEQLEFVQEDPIIRDISVYGELVRDALQRPPTKRRNAE